MVRPLMLTLLCYYTNYIHNHLHVDRKCTIRDIDSYPGWGWGVSINVCTESIKHQNENVLDILNDTHTLNIGGGGANTHSGPHLFHWAAWPRPPFSDATDSGSVEIFVTYMSTHPMVLTLNASSLWALPVTLDDGGPFLDPSGCFRVESIFTPSL